MEYTIFVLITIAFLLSIPALFSEEKVGKFDFEKCRNLPYSIASSYNPRGLYREEMKYLSSEARGVSLCLIKQKRDYGTYFVFDSLDGELLSKKENTFID